MNPVTVVFSADEAYAGMLEAAVLSIMGRLAGFVVVAIINNGFSDRIAKIRAPAQQAVYVFNLDDTDRQGFPCSRWPPATYGRLLAAHVLPDNFHRVIYLDSDVLVHGDIAELFNVDLGGKTIAAVADFPQEERQRQLREYCTVTGVPWDPAARYFNSGVMVMDLDRWRERDIEAKTMALIRSRPDKREFMDQDPLNSVLMGDWQELPKRFNYMPVPANPAPENPLIVHYAGDARKYYPQLAGAAV